MEDLVVAKDGRCRVGRRRAYTAAPAEQTSPPATISRQRAPDSSVNERQTKQVIGPAPEDGATLTSTLLRSWAGTRRSLRPPRPRGAGHLEPAARPRRRCLPVPAGC